MLMKTNLFKQFRKDTETLKASTVTERTFQRTPIKETLLWGGLDDTSGSNSCDIDEEDDYFPSNSFMLESSNSPTDSLHDCEWPKSNQYMESIKRFQGNSTPTSVPKLSTNIRMRVAQFPQRDVQVAQLDTNLLEIQKSPPPSKRPTASASPMVKFLRNFKEEDKMRSPDTAGKVDEDVKSPCIQSDVEQHNGERQQTDKELICLMREIDFLSTENVEQKIINSKLLIDSTRDKEHIENKEQYVRVLEEAKTFLEEQLKEETSRLKDVEKKLEVSERLLEEKESKIAKSKVLDEEKTLQINMLTTELSNVQDEVKLAQSEFGEFRQQATVEKNALKENIQVLKSGVMDEIILLTEIKKLDEANLMRQVEEITQLKQELRDVLNVKSDLKTKLDDILIRFHETKAECEQLRMKEERMEQQLQTDKSSAAKSALEKEETETKLRAANEELRVLQNKLLENEEEVTQLKTNCRDYLKQNKELQMASEDEKKNKELAEQEVASLTKTIK
ncbi:hypothetical protein X801_10458, partial [Opisthorchis viverrini]